MMNQRMTRLCQNCSRRCWATFLAVLGIVSAVTASFGAAVADSDWPAAMLKARAEFLQGRPADRAEAEKFWTTLARRFPRQETWVLQDHPDGLAAWLCDPKSTAIEAAMIRRACEPLGDGAIAIQSELRKLIDSNVSGDDRRWLDLYEKTCELRRANRLRPVWEKHRRFVFVKRQNLAIGGSNHFAYTESLSDIQHPPYDTFQPGSALCILTADESGERIETLLEDAGGVLRDPDVSKDGRRLLFSWKKSAREDDFHLYEMDIETRRVRQLTKGLGYADFEGIYLPDGNILFHSTRCIQTVDCDMAEVSNLYLCAGDGGRIRRVGFDQVHTMSPTLMPDGRILVTRWDYNDRSQVWPQGLIQMNPDGTGQTEYYGNNSWFPTSILHARAVPGSSKVVAILSGHHSLQQGKLALIDNRHGRQEADGVQLIAPIRKTEPVHVDAYGLALPALEYPKGELFRYPYPLDEQNYLVSHTPEVTPWKQFNRPYDLYWVSIDGEKELLAHDPTLGSFQIVPLAPREPEHQRPTLVDHRRDTGTFFVQDIYHGPGLTGVPRGTVKRLRVVALDFRPANVGRIPTKGPGGESTQCGPIAVGNGSYDIKRVLGTVEVEEDGSALFDVPARTPVYFQGLDAKGHVVQSMRSWSTLQPGEYFGCVGCHENKATTPQPAALPIAMKRPAQQIVPFYGPPRGFSYAKEIQPIWNQRCIGCHHVSAGQKADAEDKNAAFSLLDKPVPGGASQRLWTESYLVLTKANPSEIGEPNEIVNWLNVQSVPSMLPPYYAGSSKSKLVSVLEAGHYNAKLSAEEMDKIACWIDLLVPFCGDYAEAARWGPADQRRFERRVEKRREMEELDRQSRRQLSGMSLP